jgi:hypothetical protein
MLNEIKNGNNEFNKLLQIYQDTIEKYPLILSILEGRQIGQVFCTNDFENILVVSKSGFCYGSFEDKNFEAIYDFILNEDCIPNYLHFYSPSKTFLKFILQKTDKYKLRNRVQYQYKGERSDYNGNYQLPDNYSIMSIEDVDFDKLRVFELDLEKKYWCSIKDFQSNAIGYVIIDENQLPAAICYSACITSKHAEMDTLVSENHRSKGFMRLVSIPFFKKASEEELLTHWDTFEENISSFRMGAKFDPDVTYKYNLLSVFFENE